MAKYTYFKRSGKYYTEGDGADVPIRGVATDRDFLLSLNGGSMPGLAADSRAASFFIVITDDDTSYPRLLHPEVSE